MKPTTLSLPDLSDGVLIVVQGTVEKEEDGRFLLDFGHSMKTTAALRMCITFASQIVLSLQMAKEKNFSFRRGFLRTEVLRFEVIVLVSDGNFKISLNGCHVCEAPYLEPLKEIDHLEVNGDVLLHRIFCQRPCYSDPQVNGECKASKNVPDMLDILLPAILKLPAGSVIHDAQPDPENLSEWERFTEIGDSSVTEADSINQHSDEVLSDDCFNHGLSADDVPHVGTDVLDSAGGSAQNSSFPGQSDRLGSPMESESLKTPTNADHFVLPYACQSPQTPAAAVSSAGPKPSAGYEFAKNPVMPDRQDAAYPPAQYMQSQTPVMFDQANMHSSYPRHMPNQTAEMPGYSNAPYPFSGCAYQQNTAVPVNWNAPYPLPSSASGQNPVVTCQSTVPSPVYHYPGYTPNLYPPLPTGPDAPYILPGHEAHRQNPVMPSYGIQSPFYPPPYPICNQQPGTDATRALDWTHANMSKFFPEGLRLNQAINIYGEFLPNPSGFTVWMSNGETENADVFLNMVVSFSDRMVTRSRKIYGRWSQIENSLSHFPFQAGRHFHVAIVCYYNLFRVFGNEKHLFDFQTSMNLSEITSVKIFGMVTAVNIVG